MQPAAEARPEFVAAFAELAGRIAASLATIPARSLPIRMIVAGGAAVHLYTGARVSRDIDASFSHRLALPQDLRVAYRDADGRAQVLYFDYQHNDTLALLHEDAHADAVALRLPGVDRGVLDVRLLTPVDLAVSKLARFAAVDRGDITELARKGLIAVTALRRRAEAALEGYVGDLTRIRRSLDMACNLVADARRNARS